MQARSGEGGRSEQRGDSKRQDRRGAVLFLWGRASIDTLAANRRTGSGGKAGAYVVIRHARLWGFPAASSKCVSPAHYAYLAFIRIE
jgi:hypothetical protein